MCLEHPFTMIVAGPSGSGKTWLTCKMIFNRETLTTAPPSKIIYCYKYWQPIFMELDHTEFVEGLPDDILDRFDADEPGWLILDDFQSECGKSPLVADIFTRSSHHRNIACFLIVQTVFFRGPYAKDISSNASYVILLKNPRNYESVVTLARQSWGKEGARKVGEIFKHVTKEPHSYLFLSFKPTTPEDRSILSHCFGEAGPILYSYRIHNRT